jgi:hypothetical protein
MLSAKVNSKNESSFHVIREGEKEMCASFAFVPQTAKVMT